MLFVKVTRSNATDGVYQHAMIAGPYEDDVDAQYIRKQLAKGDSNRDSKYEVVECDWVVSSKRGEDKSQVVAWFETEADAFANAAIMQRSDYTVVVEPMKYKDWLTKCQT